VGKSRVRQGAESLHVHKRLKIVLDDASPPVIRKQRVEERTSIKTFEGFFGKKWV